MARNIRDTSAAQPMGAFKDARISVDHAPKQSSSDVPITHIKVITVRATTNGTVTVPFDVRRESIIKENRIANLGDDVKKPFTGNSV